MGGLFPKLPKKLEEDNSSESIVCKLSKQQEYPTQIDLGTLKALLKAKLDWTSYSYHLISQEQKEAVN